MNDPFILYAIARFANTTVLLNMVRASRQFHTLVAQNIGVQYDLMDHYAVNGVLICSDGSKIMHGKQILGERPFGILIKYWRRGNLHRDNDLPALIVDREDNDNDSNFWYRDNMLHRDGDLPAIISRNGDQKWYNNNELHRDGDLPAIIYSNGDKYWFQHGKKHRDGDRPAIMLANGDQYWMIQDCYHRDGDQPAWILADGTRHWYQSGVLLKAEH